MLRPILGPDGQFEGAALAYLNLSYFEDFYRAVDLGEDGAILLHLRDGTVLARYPHKDVVVGAELCRPAAVQGYSGAQTWPALS